MKSIIETLKKAQWFFEEIHFPDGHEAEIKGIQIGNERLVCSDDVAAVCRCNVVTFDSCAPYLTINNRTFQKAQHVKQILENFEIPKDELPDLIRDPELLEYFDVTIPPEVKQAIQRIIDKEYKPATELETNLRWLALME